MRLILCVITNYGKILCIFTRPSTYILDVAISEAVGGSLLHFFSGRLTTRVSTRRCRSLVLMLRISLNWPYVLKSGYVCIMECSIDIVHLRWHTYQHSTLQNQEISGGLLLWLVLLSFCLVPILATRGEVSTCTCP